MKRHEHDQGADAGRGYRRENGDRMDRALIEHAEDQVDHDQRRADQNGRARQRGLEGLRIALKIRGQRGRAAELSFGILDLGHGLADRDSREKVEGDRHRGKLSLMVDDDGCGVLDGPDQGIERHLLPDGRGDVDVAERTGPILEFRIDLQNDVVLVQRRVHRRNDALTEGIGQGIVDGGGQDAMARRRVAVDRDIEPGAAIFLIARHVGDAGQASESVEEQRGPVIQLGRIGVGERELVLGLGQARADGDVLGRLHIERDALDLGEFRAQPIDHLVGAGAALALRLEGDEHAAVVQRRGGAAGADLRADRRHGRILQHGADDRLHALGHRREGDVLRGLGDAQDHSRVLLRKEALGNDDIEVAGQRHRAQHHHQGDEAVAKRHLEATLVEAEKPVESPLQHAVEPSVPFLALAEQPRAHHGRERQ